MVPPLAPAKRQAWLRKKRGGTDWEGERIGSRGGISIFIEKRRAQSACGRFGPYTCEVPDHKRRIYGGMLKEIAMARKPKGHLNQRSEKTQRSC